MATIKKRANKQWQAKIRRATYPSVSKTFEVKKDAEAWAREIESSMDHGTYVSLAEAETTTLKKALERYLIEITPLKKGASAESYRIKAWMERDLARRPLAKIRGTDMAAYRDERLKAGMSASSIRNELNIISHVYNIARKEWGMEGLHNPVEHVRKPKPAKGRDRRLQGDEEQHLLDAASSPAKEMIILALETGMRMGELLNMDWKMVDLKNAVVRLEDTKNGERRDVPLSGRAVKTLKGLPRNINGNVIQKMTSGSMSHRFQKLCEDLKIDDLRFHDLRHEATSRFFEKGFNPMEVSAITGHKTLHMLKRYTHLKAEDLAKRLG